MRVRLSIFVCLAWLMAACGSSSRSPDAASGGRGGAGGSGGRDAGADVSEGGAAGAGGQGGASDAGADVHDAGTGGSGGLAVEAGDAGDGGCGGALCTTTQICVHPSCPNCICLPGDPCPRPKPFCADVPAGCHGTATCSCLAFLVCSSNGGAGGICMSVDERGAWCG